MRGESMNYLQRVHAETKTRYWVNNPTIAECDDAVAQGAYACTTNPAYCSKLFQTDPEYIGKVITTVLKKERNVSMAAEKVYHLIAKDLMDRFLPVNANSGGKAGFVTIQEDPRREEDHAYILEASLRAKALGPNYMAKIPVTEQGLKVIAEMVKHDIPICATEVFSLSQAVVVYELYQESVKKYGKKPPIYITHITGIMDQYFKELVAKESVKISKEALELAGTVIGLREYRLFRERGYDTTMLGGGARGLHHFTNFVGGDMHVTINWSTALELNASLSATVPMIDRQIPDSIVDELLEKLPNFKRAYELDGMEVEEFADYGPVMLFRTQFMNGYSRLIDGIHLAK